jgi:hypothetical protein
MLPKSHSCLGRKRLGRPRQVPRHWQASVRQYLYPVVTGSVLGFPSARLLVVSQLECPVSFFGAASTSAPPYKADPGTFAIAPFGRHLRPAVAYGDGYSKHPHPRGVLALYTQHVPWLPRRTECTTLELAHQNGAVEAAWWAHKLFRQFRFYRLYSEH